ncbi:MAG: cupin [Bacteroidetes bacterium]|nr:MAG: cupin [Bacteroidota bacterium]
MKNANFEKEALFEENKPAIRLMLETENTKEIRILMKKGQVMRKHQTAYPIVVHLIWGAIDFWVEGTTHALESGAILSLDRDVPHSLVAKEDSMVRLSLAKQDSLHRVTDVVTE